MTTTDPTLSPTDPDGARPDTGAGTGTRGTRIIGIATIIAMGWLVAFGLGFSPEDRDQRESVRLLYVHVPTIWIAYLAFIVTAVASGVYFFGKQHSMGWDRLAGASAEIGTAFVAVTLVIGAMWGRLTWGVFWQWDARLTTTALLFVTYIGYLAVRRPTRVSIHSRIRSAICRSTAPEGCSSSDWPSRSAASPPAGSGAASAPRLPTRNATCTPTDATRSALRTTTSWSRGTWFPHCSSSPPYRGFPWA